MCTYVCLRMFVFVCVCVNRERRRVGVRKKEKPRVCVCMSSHGAVSKNGICVFALPSTQSHPFSRRSKFLYYIDIIQVDVGIGKAYIMSFLKIASSFASWI